MILGLSWTLGVIVADQLSKYVVLHWVLGQSSGFRIFDFFNVVRAWNTGVSFSMLNDYGRTGMWVLIIMALLIVAMLFYWLKNEKDKVTQVALGLIMGGALGNVIDRVIYGAVFDFLDFHIGDTHWPAFNVADSCICIGAVIIVLQSICAQFSNKENRNA